MSDEAAESKKCENGVHYVNECQCSLSNARAELKALTNAARALRSAQRWYMSNRGNPDAGKSVAVAAKALDVVLGDA